VAVVLAAVAAQRKDRLGLLMCVIGPAVPVFLTEYLAKPAFDRMLGVHGPVYPSGHVTGASAVAMVAVALAYRYGGRAAALLTAPIAALLPALVSLGVIGEYYHYATDAFGGGAVGVATVLTTAMILDAAERRAAAPSNPPAC
jgi:membrane-associated phospholipid phosphatase